MKLFETQLEIMNVMDSLISEGKTGTPQEFAGKLNCKVPTFFVYLRYMRKELYKDKKIVILYNHTEHTYMYSRQGKYRLGWTWIPEGQLAS